MKNRKTLLAVLAGLALSSCTTRVTTENDASLKGVLGDKFYEFIRLTEIVTVFLRMNGLALHTVLRNN